MNAEISDAALWHWAASLVALLLCGLATRQHLTIRYDHEPPRWGSGWIRLLLWSALAGCIYAYYSGDVLLCAITALLSGAALTADLLAFRDVMRAEDDARSGPADVRVSVDDSTSHGAS